MRLVMMLKLKLVKDENKTIIGLKWKSNRTRWWVWSWDENKTIIGLKFTSSLWSLCLIRDENKTIIGLK